MMHAPSTPAPDIAERSGTLLLWSALLAGCAFVWFIFSYGYIEDDAYIHLEFARSVAEGKGFAFNGVVTNGDTSPVWVLLLDGLHALGLGWMEAAKLACILGFGVAVTAVWTVARDLSLDNPRGHALALASVAVTVCNPFFVHWAFSGMETLTALGLSLWAIWAVFLGQPTWRRLLFGAALLGIGPVLRPELAILAAIAAPALAWRWFAGGGLKSAPSRKLGLIVPALVMLLPAATWCLFAVHAFGSIVPNTNLAKRGGGLADLIPRIASVYALGFPITLALLPFAMRRLGGQQRVPVAVWILLLWPLGCLLFYLGDHTSVQTRYCLLSMPSMTIGVLYLLDDVRRPNLFRTAVISMVLVAALLVGWIVVPHVENKARNVRAFTQVAAFLQDKVPAESPVAVFAIGEIAFTSRHPLIDTGGITRPGVIPYLNDARAQLRWAKANGAQYIITGDFPEPGAVPVFATTAPYIGWTLHRSLYQTQNPLAVYKLP